MLHRLFIYFATAPRKQMLHFRECINDFLVRNDLTPIGKKEFVNNWINAVDAWENNDFEMDEEYYDQEEDSASSFFGPIDKEEVESIRFAEEQERKMKKTLAYFQEELEEPPNDINMASAEEFYYQWENSQYNDKKGEHKNEW